MADSWVSRMFGTTEGSVDEFTNALDGQKTNNIPTNLVDRGRVNTMVSGYRAKASDARLAAEKATSQRDKDRELFAAQLFDEQADDLEKQIAEGVKGETDGISFREAATSGKGLQWLGEKGLENAYQLGGQVTTSFLGPAGLGINMLSGQQMVQGETVNEMRKKGVAVDDQKAQEAGLIYGTTEALIGKGGGNVVRGLVDGAKTVGKAIAKEGGQEAFTQAGILNQTIAAGGEYTGQEIGDQLVDAAVSPTATSGALSAGSSLVQSVGQTAETDNQLPVMTSSENYGPIEIKIPQGGGTVTLDVKPQVDENDFIDMVLARDEEQPVDPDADIQAATREVEERSKEKRKKFIEKADEPNELGLVSRLRKLANNPKFVSGLPKKGPAKTYFAAVEKMIEKGELNIDEWRLSPAYMELGQNPDQIFERDQVLFNIAMPYQFVEERQFGINEQAMVAIRGINNELELFEQKIDSIDYDIQVERDNNVPADATTEELLLSKESELDGLIAKIESIITADDFPQVTRVEREKIGQIMQDVRQHNTQLMAEIGRHPTAYKVSDPDGDGKKVTSMGTSVARAEKIAKLNDMVLSLEQSELESPNFIGYSRVAEDRDAEPSRYLEFSLKLPYRSDLTKLQEELPETSVHKSLGDPNTLVFARTSLGFTQQGERILYIDEIQSDMLNRGIGKDVSFPDELTVEIDSEAQARRQAEAEAEEQNYYVEFNKAMPIDQFGVRTLIGNSKELAGYFQGIREYIQDHILVGEIKDDVLADNQVLDYYINLSPSEAQVFNEKLNGINNKLYQTLAETMYPYEVIDYRPATDQANMYASNTKQIISEYQLEVDQAFQEIGVGRGIVSDLLIGYGLTPESAVESGVNTVNSVRFDNDLPQPEEPYVRLVDPIPFVERTSLSADPMTVEMTNLAEVKFMFEYLGADAPRPKPRAFIDYFVRYLNTYHDNEVQNTDLIQVVSAQDSLGNITTTLGNQLEQAGDRFIEKVIASYVREDGDEARQGYKDFRREVNDAYGAFNSLMADWGESYGVPRNITLQYLNDKGMTPNGLAVVLTRRRNTVLENQQFDQSAGQFSERSVKREDEQYVPARNKLYDMMMRRLIAYAVQQDYDGVALSTSVAQVNRWSDRYQKLYEDLYDSRFPKALGKLTGNKPNTEKVSLAASDANVEPVTEQAPVMRFTPAKKEQIRKEGIPLLRDTAGEQQGGLSLDEAQAAAQSVLSKMRIGDELKVTMYPNVPEGFPKARGWVTKGGDVVIVAGAHKNAQDVQETVLHEIVGHYGIRRIMSQEDISKLMTRINIAVRRDGEFQTAVNEMKARGVSMDNPAEFAEEIFAFMAEQPMTKFQQIRAEIVAVLKEVMRKLGFNVAEITEAEVMRVVARSAQAINRGEKIKADSAFGQGKTVELDNQDVADGVARGLADPNQPELLRERDVAIIPERNIDAVNERMGLNLEKRREGTYIGMDDGSLTDEVMNGEVVNNATIGINDRGMPKMRVDQAEEGDAKPAVDAKGGNVVRINMFKTQAGWKWIDEPKGLDYPVDKFVVSTTTSWKGKSGKHFYSLEVDSPIPIELSNYPKEPNEPRSRPTTNGVPVFGKPVGTISVRGKPHTVYDKVTIIKKGDPIPEGMTAEPTEGDNLDTPVAFRLEGGNDSMPEMAINVRVDSAAGLDYAELIINGDKTYETRDSDSLRPYVGRRVGIARTGAGKAQAIGSVEIGEPLVVSEEEFRSLQDQHMVPEGSAFDIKAGGQKFLYPVSNPERFDQPMDVGAGIVSRRIVADASTPSRYDVDTLINEEIPEGVNNKADFVKFIDGLQDRPRDLEADRDAIAEDLARETEIALNKSGNAAEWYRETIAGAMTVAAKVFPEIGTDSDAKAAFQFALAITSNGAGVDENTINAVNQYQSFRRTGKFPEKGWGKETEAMVNSFRVFNRLIDTYGLTELNRLMNMEWTAGDLKELGFNVSGELADAPMYFSAIFGPKIGQGFYQNLGGNWTPLTMDRWFMRTIGRVTGRLSMYDNQKHVGYVEAARKATEEPNSGIELAISRYNKNATEKVTIDDFMNDFDVATDVLMAGYRAWSQSSFDKSMDLPVMRTGRSLSKLFDTRDAPSTGTERAQIRALMNDVQQKLADKGLDLDMASIQALLWFPEKDLYLHFGVTSKKATPTDYEQEMIKVARKNGISKKEIEDGLRNKTQSPDGESDGSADRQDRGEGRSDAQLRDAVRRDQYVRRLGQEIGGGDGAFRRGSRKTNTLNLPSGRQKVDGTSYKVGTGWKRTLLSKLQSAAGSPTEYVELAPSKENAQLFTDLITRAAQSHGDRGRQVYIYDVEEIADAKLFITPDGLGGFAVKKDGDIVSLFATAQGPFKNVSFTALALAVQSGGVKLDAFDPVLPKLYRRMGFSTAARVAFDPNEKPDGWNTETMGEPDVHFMVFDPAGVVEDNAETVAYGKAITMQNLAKTKAKKAAGKIKD